MATSAYKATLALRYLLAELPMRLAQVGPTPFYMDATAVLGGVGGERLRKLSRWLAVRYAMLRWGIGCGTIDPLKVHTRDNKANGLTKALTGDEFANARAQLLGLPRSGEETSGFAAVRIALSELAPLAVALAAAST